MCDNSENLNVIGFIAKSLNSPPHYSKHSQNFTLAHPSLTELYSVYNP